MGQTLIIDPITRIEGHLRVELVLNDARRVEEAYVSGTLYRGIETILKGRDPRDAGLLAQRICGVCTNVHYRGSVTAVENAYGIGIPANAETIRNLVTLSLFIQDHVVHFYHLHLLDFVDVTKALDADPRRAEGIAYLYSDNPYRNSAAHLTSVKEKLTKFVQAGRLGLFAGGYWGHKAYRLDAEESLILLSHYFEALEFQKELSKAIAIFAGKTPHPQNLVVGGVTSVADMLNPQRLNDFLFLLASALDFVRRAYMPDMHLLVTRYRDEMKAGDGRSGGNFFAVGGYAFGGGQKLFEGGVIYGFDFGSVHAFDAAKVTEGVERSWFDVAGEVAYTDLNNDGSLKTEGKYSWIKTPRYDGQPFECGPVARLLVGYLRQSPVITPYMTRYMKLWGMELEDFATAVGRNAARAIEALIVNEFVFDFVNALTQHIKYYDDATWTSYRFEELPTVCSGESFWEVPRGVLTHRVAINEGKIAHYRVIAPTTWNAAPKDASDRRSPYEAALVGITIADPAQPLEALRVVHSFDPCLACAVHVIDTKEKDLTACRRD